MVLGYPFNIFGAEIPPLYFFWAIGIVLMTVYYIVFADRFGLRRWQGLVMSLSFLVIEIIGAVILANIESLEWVMANGPKIGFSMFGIMFSLPLGNLLLAKIFKKSWGDVMDYCAPGILIELVLYRVGCTFAGCCHGLVNEGFGIVYYPSMQRYFPSQPIEAIFDAALMVLLIYMLLKKKYPKGTLYALFLIGYSGVRFFVEFTRERDVLFLGMSRSHLFCLLWLAVGIYVLLATREREQQRQAHRAKHSHK